MWGEEQCGGGAAWGETHGVPQHAWGLRTLFLNHSRVMLAMAADVLSCALFILRSFLATHPSTNHDTRIRKTEELDGKCHRTDGTRVLSIMDSIEQALTEFLLRAAKNGVWDQHRVVSALFTITPSFRTDRVFLDMMPLIAGMFQCQVMLGKYEGLTPPSDPDAFHSLGTRIDVDKLPPLSLSEARRILG